MMSGEAVYTDSRDLYVHQLNWKLLLPLQKSSIANSLPANHPEEIYNHYQNASLAAIVTQFFLYNHIDI